MAASRRPEDAERFVEEVRGDDPDLASYLRIEEWELEAQGLLVSATRQAMTRACRNANIRHYSRTTFGIVG